MKSPVTIGSFDLTTRHDLIMHLVGLSVRLNLSFGLRRWLMHGLYSSNHIVILSLYKSPID